MSLAHSFPPVARTDAKVLILGSMPGLASLEAQQYYAHPRNAFWPIMEALFHVDSEASYTERCEELVASRIALWDVMQSCVRPGSLDSSIDDASIEPNDFTAFLRRHENVSRIFFNGAKAHQVFRRHVVPALSATHCAILRHQLTSTSPANARFALSEKIAMWRPVKLAIES